MYVGIGRINTNSGSCKDLSQGERCVTLMSCRCIDLKQPEVMAELKALIRAHTGIPMSDSFVWTQLDEARYAGWVDRTASWWSGPTEEELAQQTPAGWVFPAVSGIKIMLEAEGCLAFENGGWHGWARYPILSNFYADLAGQRGVSISTTLPIIGADTSAPGIDPEEPATLPETVEIEELVIVETPPPRQAGAPGVILVGSLVAGIGP